MAAKRPRSKREESALKWRAVAAFAKYAGPELVRAPFDETKVSIVEARDHLGESKLYVVLSVGEKQLAVFRVRVDGQLKRLRRPPKELRGDED